MCCYLRAGNTYLWCIIYSQSAEYRPALKCKWAASSTARACTGWTHPNAPPLLLQRPSSPSHSTFPQEVFQGKTTSAFHLLSWIWGFLQVAFGALCLSGNWSTFRGQSRPCRSCSLESPSTPCSWALTASSCWDNVCCTWPKLGLFTQPSHLLRKKVPFPSRNTPAPFPVPSGKNNWHSRVILLSLCIQAEFPSYSTWKRVSCNGHQIDFQHVQTSL